MYFYCTTLVGDYHKVGISSSLIGVKKRLTTYRSIAPSTKILFFTQVDNGEDLERSFKNKFGDQRIGRSECYNLRSDIIFSHVLKYIHRDQIHNIYKKDKFIKKEIFKTKELFGIWRRDSYNLSNYYLDGGYSALDFLGNKESKYFKYEHLDDPIQPYELTENEIYRWDILKGFFPVSRIVEENKRNKNNQIIEKSRKSILFFCDLSTKKKFSEFIKKKREFLNQYYNKKTYVEQVDLFDGFIKQYYKKKIFTKDNNPHSFFHEYLYDCLKTNVPHLLKGYKHNFENTYGNKFSNAHKRLPYSRKIKNLFKNTNFRKKNFGLKAALSKNSYYSMDDIILFLKEMTDFPTIDYFNVNKNKLEILQKIRRIHNKHSRDAFVIIEKNLEDLKKNEE